MYLARLFIKNYRSIKELDLRFSKGKNVIIGRNNTGKSNIVKALDLVLGESSPTFAKGENITDDDFYSWKEQVNGRSAVQTASDIFIWAELERDREEVLNYDEIYKCFGFYVYSQVVRWENKKPIKHPVRIHKDELPATYETIFELNEDTQEKDYINPKLRHQKTFEQQFDDKFSFALAFRAAKDEQGDISKGIRFLYREGNSSDWILGFKAPIRNELLQSAIIPSFRDPQNQLRLSSWTWYGKLMQHLTSGQDKSTELQSAFDNVRSVADKIFERVEEKVASSSLDVAFPGTELHFQFNADSGKDLYKTCLLYVDDGFKSLLTEKGSGIQSATIIGLFNYYTQHVSTVTSALLCVEEPEIYLHPHARRVISDRLDEFLNGNKNQVILTTHSVEFIRTTYRDLNLILATKEAQGTKAIPVNIQEFKGLLIENNQNELFFADKVIVCEGYDDFVLRAIARESFPKRLDEQNVSIVSAGSKDNISHLVKLILKLGIKCFLLADFDYLLRDKMADREKYEAKAHECILSVGEVFFAQKCTFGSDGKGVFASIQKLRDALKKGDEKAFYTAKRSESFSNPALPSLLETLRRNGVCILNGEIENYSKDASFISSSQKLTLNKIYDLSALLSSTTKIVDLFETGEICEFLDVVFGR